MDARRGNPWRPVVWGLAGGLLLLPAVAMQFTRDVEWTAFDFMAFGAMLLAACGAYEFAAWISGNKVYRAAAGLAVIAGFLLTWINLAVGIIHDEHAQANLLFFGVLLVGIVGACSSPMMPTARLIHVSRKPAITARPAAARYTLLPEIHAANS